MRSIRPVACVLLAAVWSASAAHAQPPETRNIRYGTAHERQVLDVYAPAGANRLPVVFSR